MPLIRQDALPITREELRGLQGRLLEPFAFEIVVRGEQRHLFVKAPSEEPDPVSDLEACLEELPDWALDSLADVFLLGERGSFHVPGHTVAPLVERRARVEAGTVAALRAGLDAQYGSALHRVSGDAHNVLRLGVRVPRSRLTELSESDLVRIAQALGPFLDSGEAGRVRVAYVLADEDHVRLRGPELFEDVRPRWEEIQTERRRLEPAPLEEAVAPEPPEAPNLEVPAPEPVPAAVPRRRPKRVVRVEPVFELQSEVHAVEPDDAAQQNLLSAETALAVRLKDAGYDVLERVQHEGVQYALAAERAAVYPRRVVVRTLPLLARAEADALVRAARRLGADLLLVVAARTEEDAVRRCRATKVKVISPAQVASFSP